MTIATNTHHLRPSTLVGAAARSRAWSIERKIALGLLRDGQNRRLVLMDLREAERRLKERKTNDC